VCDEDGVTGKLEEPPHRLGRAGCTAQLLVPEAGQGACASCDRSSRIDEGLELADYLEAAQPYGADLADPGLAGPQPRRLEVDDDVGGLFEQERRARWLGE
jgi:hypothetical protein